MKLAPLEPSTPAFMHVLGAHDGLKQRSGQTLRGFRGSG